MKKKTTRVRKPTRKQWMKKLDALVTEIVRLRDVRCVTCGSTEQLGCGHLFTRTWKSTCWDLQNCNLQCWPCNFYHENHPERYTLWFLKRWGQEAYEKLAAKHVTPSHFKIFDFESMYTELETIRDAYKNAK